MVVHDGEWWCTMVHAVLDTKLPTAERQSDALEVRRAGGGGLRVNAARVRYPRISGARPHGPHDLREARCFRERSKVYIKSIYQMLQVHSRDGVIGFIERGE